MKIMIHACPSRMWYVDGFLIPSMKEQGIQSDEITVWNDDQKKGCLESCMQAFLSCNGGATWHLQDDVLICHDFAERVRELDEGGYDVICGFCHTLFEPFNRPMVGEVPAIYSFNSFPCIRIPDDYARECAEWFYNDARYRDYYQNWVRSGIHDDGFWHDWLIEQKPHERVLNTAPALVEHVDWIIGGSTINTWRGYVCRASYWEDEYLVDELLQKIAHKRFS